MKRLICTLVAVGLVGASPRVWASCRAFGSQLHCTLGRAHLLIGTQVAVEPRPVGTPPRLFLRGADGLFDEHPVISWPVRVELQNVGTDPGLCWRFGDETYCH